METFNDLNFQPLDHEGSIQAIIHFNNGYSASVVRHRFSYGNEDGLYELAVINKNGDIDYTTSVTNDVLGYQTEDDITSALADIQRLTPASENATLTLLN